MGLFDKIGSFVERRPYVSYLVLFAAMLFLMCFNSLRWGRGFIWAIDGLEQQYPLFIAEGAWWRELAGNVSAGNFTVPQWSMVPGYGDDYVTMLSSSLGNPFNIISVFCNAANAELFLSISCIAQLIVAGLVFLRYCAHRGFSGFSSVLGAIVYVFSGFSVLVFYQTFMLYPLVLAPILLMGVDYVFDGKTPLVLVGGFALSGLYGPTFSYAACLLLFVYCVVRYALLDERKSVGGFLAWFARIAGCILLGLLVACILLLPYIQTILGEDRLGLERPQQLLYSWWYYQTLYTGFLCPVDLGADCNYGFAPVALVAVVALFVTRRKGDKVATTLISMLVVMTVFLCLPFFGRMFNGFAYPNNRWVWAFVLAVGLTVAYALPLVDGMRREKRMVLVAACGAYLVVGALLLVPSPTLYYAGALVVAALLVLAVGLQERWSRIARPAALLSTLAWCGVVFLLWGRLFWPSLALEWGEAYDIDVAESPARMVLDIPADAGGGFRYDGANYDDHRNAPLALGFPGSSFYNSYYNSLIDKYHTELGLSCSDLNFSYINFSSRTSLEALAGVRYYVTPADNSARLPQMYSRELATAANAAGDLYVLSEAESALPLAFSYGRTVSRESYERLPMLQKQEALLQGMVAESGEYDAAQLDYSMLESLSWQGGLSADGGVIVADGAGEPMTMQVDVPAGKNMYLVIEGLEGVDWMESGQAYVEIVFESGHAVGELLEYFPASHLFAGKRNWVVNMGHADEDRHEVRMYLDTPGTFTYSSFGIVLEDEGPVTDMVSSLAAAGYENVRYAGNEVSGPVNVPAGGRYVYFRIPYSAGWSASVDGQPVEIEHANTGFMAVWVDEGSHDVRLSYSTPGLRLGASLTLLGLVATAAVMLMRAKRKRAGQVAGQAR